METLQYLSQAPPTQEDCLSFLIYSSVFIARKAYSSFSEFFPTVVYEWQEQEGCWSVEEQQAFKESHDCFSKIDEMNDVTMYVANLVLFCEGSKIFFLFLQDLGGYSGPSRMAGWSNATCAAHSNIYEIYFAQSY